MAYSDEQKALVAAAVERYGETVALEILRENWALSPSRGSVHAWVRVEGVLPTQDALVELSTFEHRRRARLQVEVEQRMQPALEAFDEACTSRSFLGMQQSATAVGILYDKLVPPLKTGTSIDARTQVLAPAFVPWGRAEEEPDTVEADWAR